MEIPDETQTEREQVNTETKAEDTPVTEEQLTEVISSYIDNPENSEKTSEEPVEKPVEEPSEPEPAEEPEVPEEQSQVVNEDIVKQYPALKPFQGKPLTEAFKAYDELRRSTTKLTQELSELKKQSAKSGSQQPDVEEEVPDPVDEPEKFKKYFKNLSSKLKAEAKAEVLTELTGKLEILEKTIAPITIEKKQQEITNLIKSQLPDADVTQVIEDWKNDNSDLLFDNNGDLNNELVSFYDQHPEIFIRDVVKSYKLKKIENQYKENQKNQKLAVADKVKKAIKQVGSGKNIPQAEVNTTPRTEEPLSDTDRLLSEILTNINE